MSDSVGIIGAYSNEARSFEPSAAFRAQARLGRLEDYQRLYRESLDSPETFWARETAELSFRSPPRRIVSGGFEDARWFEGATLNVTESCLDRHLTTSADKAALIWEGEPGEVRRLSYAELHAQVVTLARALRSLGVRAGDRVVIYMGMVPETVIAMLACARVGAPHSVVFGGFAADALRERIRDSGARVVLTQDGAWRRGKVVELKRTVDEALSTLPEVEHVVVYERLGPRHAPIQLQPGRDLTWQELHGGEASGAPEIVGADHPLFVLYTSGSTGKPKGVVHSTAGYLAAVHVSTRYVFDLKPEDVFWCTADVGWVTGHSYLVYGPLSNGATCVMYEGAPNQPDWGRFWQLIERHRVSILYTAPTAIRAFIRQGPEHVQRADLSSLRLLGSVGEPINPEAWIWYYETVGQSRCPIVDTWWQTETGSILLTTLPGVHAARPGSAGLPFFGAEPAIVRVDGSPVGAQESGLLTMKRAWPGMLAGVWGDPARYHAQYFAPIPGHYFSGDGAHQDADGYYRVVGRIDDVLNVAGHRIGTAEVESALVSHPAVAEAAAVGRPDELKGQALVVFVCLKPSHAPGPALAAELGEHVAREIGRFAKPDDVRFAEALPKTRSGKIMRRFLKDLVAGQAPRGDTSTLEDLNVLVQLQQAEE